MGQSFAALASTLLLAACAGGPFLGADIAPGTARQDVIGRLGSPTRVVAIPGGERLQYSGQPYGRYAWMVDLDGAGRVTRAQQVLTSGGFNRIVPGQWTRADLERELGPPARIDGVSSWNGPVLTYFWRDVDRSDMFYWVYLDERGVVQRAHPGMEFINAPNDRD